MKKNVILNVEFLKKFLEKNNISESELAEKIGVAHSTVNRVMNGKRNPGGKFITGLLSEFTNLTFGEVFILDNNLPKGNKTA